ncbi:hypothetical protein SGM_2124 [Streptomyces griseoaurantiacus M045]|uniref:Uncharacterized protein n=1 Tax=Streptomyces griseoaurantiacus M045 TaxID=996637 RepID=F3NG60_9ACTN|nr:hypothetical protein SGM_2124 [Streptomyces griseoaurantiacus M045]
MVRQLRVLTAVQLDPQVPSGSAVPPRHAVRSFSRRGCRPIVVDV